MVVLVLFIFLAVATFIFIRKRLWSPLDHWSAGKGKDLVYSWDHLKDVRDRRLELEIRMRRLFSDSPSPRPEEHAPGHGSRRRRRSAPDLP